MIYGETNYQRRLREEREKEQKEVWIKKFAFFPKTLSNGQEVWLQFYYRKWWHTDLLGFNSYHKVATLEEIW